MDVFPEEITHQKSYQEGRGTIVQVLLNFKIFGFFPCMKNFTCFLHLWFNWSQIGRINYKNILEWNTTYIRPPFCLWSTPYLIKSFDKSSQILKNSFLSSQFLFNGSSDILRNYCGWFLRSLKKLLEKREIWLIFSYSLFGFHLSELSKLSEIQPSRLFYFLC